MLLGCNYYSMLLGEDSSTTPHGGESPMIDVAGAACNAVAVSVNP
jgi:hypothetical protein